MRVWSAILGQALGGRPVTVPLLADRAALKPDVVISALAALHETGTIYLRDGAVVAAYPFSLVPTSHRVRIADVTVYANCAVDALAVPLMADQTAEVGATCGHCGASVTVTMRRNKVLRAHPAAPAVFYVARDCCEAGPAVLTRCPHIRFFCGRGHGEQWQGTHPRYHGTMFALADAVAFAGERFADAIRAVGGPQIA
jgi:hypothetical protein